MQTSLAQPAVDESRGNSQDAEKKEGELITNPVVMAGFNFTVGFPLTAMLCALAALVAAGIIQLPYQRLKNAPMHLKPRENRLTDITMALREDFGVEGTSEAPDALVIWCDACNLTEKPAFREALNALDSMLADLKQKESACKSITWHHYRPGMSAIETRQFLAADRTASVFMLFRNEKLQITQSSSCISIVRRQVSDINGKYGGLHLAFGNPIATAMVSMDMEVEAVMHHICISIPVLSLLFWMYVGSFFKVLTALLSMGATRIWVRAATVLVKYCWSDYNFSGSDTILMFVQLALGLDYAVIFWGRFRQERRQRPGGDAYTACVLSTLQSAGLVIMVSVAVLEVGFGGMLFYPDLNTGGNLANALSLMFSCFVVGFHSLVIPASLAVLLPSLFDEGRPSACCPSFFGGSPSGGNDEAAAQHVPAPSSAEKFFRWYAKIATRPPFVYLLPIIAYACMVPFLGQLMDYQPWYDAIETIMDKTLPEYSAYQVYKNRFSTNRAEPTMVLLKAERLGAILLQGPAAAGPRGPQRQGPQPGTAAAPAGAAATALAHALGAGPGTAPAGAARAHVRRLGGPKRLALLTQALARGPRLPALLADLGIDVVTLSPEFRNATCTLVEAIIRGTHGKKYEIRSEDVDSIWWDSDSGRCHTFPDIFKMPISHDGTEQLLNLYPNFPATGPESQDLTRFMWNEIEPSVVKTIEHRGARYRFTGRYWSSVGTMMLGDLELAHRAPYVILCTVVCICGVVAAFFGSLGVGVKVMFSVVIPIMCNYGLLVAMWQNGWFRWAGVTPTGGVISQLMFTTFGFLLGLAIDYDIVLFARVYERRLEGYDNLSAVQMGLVETGPMVTLAGTLMTSSFLIMCFDNLAMIRMLAGLYFLGVAIDTYIVRTCIAPPMLVLAGRMNYWPSKMPPETRSYSL